MLWRINDDGETLTLVKSWKLSKNRKYRDSYNEKRSPAATYSKTIKPKLLEGGNYFLSVKSTNANKGGCANFSIYLDNSVFFENTSNDGDNDWKAIQEAPDSLYNFGVLEDWNPPHALLRKSDQTDRIEEDWVGFRDDIAWRAFSIRCAAKLNFSINADDAAKVTLWKLNEIGRAHV